MKTPDTLVTCPDCGTPNIYSRALAAHRKSKNCARRRTTAPLAIAGDVLMEPGTSQQFALARRYIGGMNAVASGALAITVLLGAEFQRLHKLFGVRRGGDRRSNPHVAGLKWSELVERETGLSEDTAARYMQRAAEARKRLPDFEKIAERLFATPLADLPEVEIVEMIERTRAALPTESAQQLMWDWGLVARKGGAKLGGKTYERVEGKGARVPLTEDTAEAAAIDIWKPLLDALLREGLEESSWAALPVRGLVSIATLKGMLIDINRKLPAIES